MRRLTDLWFRLRALLGRAGMERELEEEFAFHLEREAAKYEREGLGPEEARSLARQVDAMDVSPKLAVRAEDLQRGADALEEVFSKLGTKDELVRAFETHPLLVTITNRGRDENVLPIVDTRSKQPPETNDPAGWVESQLQASGEVTVMTTSRIAYPVKAGDISDVRPADVEAVIAEKREEFQRRLRRLESGELAKDPLAWYEAAKFAYRNRLDEQVTSMLDRALELDPFLGESIKEDKAQSIFLKMVQQLENENRPAASGWKVQLDKYYTDTSVYSQAVAYYEGNMEALRLAQAQAAKQRREARRRAREERLARARALEDEQQVKEIEEEEEEVADLYDPQPDTPVAASGDRAEADAYYNKGLEILSKAQNMGVTEERDQLYAKAEKELTKARDLYQQLGLIAEMSKANQYRYACIKSRRF